MKCPRCGSKDLQKKGKRLGKQRFRCKECSCSFTEGIPYKEAPSYKKLTKECSRCGSNHIVRDGKLEDGAQRYLCKDCNLRFSDNSPDSLITDWEHVQEEITKEQKQLIIRFGYHCKVPVSYLAEYIHCSKGMCRRVLKEYEERLSPPASVPS